MAKLVMEAKGRKFSAVMSVASVEDNTQRNCDESYAPRASGSFCSRSFILPCQYESSQAQQALVILCPGTFVPCALRAGLTNFSLTYITSCTPSPSLCRLLRMTKKRLHHQPTAPVATSSARGVTATPVVAQRKAAATANKRKAIPRQQRETNALEKGNNTAVTDVVDIDEIFKSAKKRPKSAPVIQV